MKQKSGPSAATVTGTGAQIVAAAAGIGALLLLVLGRKPAGAAPPTPIPTPSVNAFKNALLAAPNLAEVEAVYSVIEEAYTDGRLPEVDYLSLYDLYLARRVELMAPTNGKATASFLARLNQAVSRRELTSINEEFTQAYQDGRISYDQYMMLYNAYETKWDELGAAPPTPIVKTASVYVGGELYLVEFTEYNLGGVMMAYVTLPSGSEVSWGSNWAGYTPNQVLADAINRGDKVDQAIALAAGAAWPVSPLPPPPPPPPPVVSGSVRDQLNSVWGQVSGAGACSGSIPVWVQRSGSFLAYSTCTGRYEIESFQTGDRISLLNMAGNPITLSYGGRSWVLSPEWNDIDW